MPSGGGWSTQRRSTFASRWDKSTSKAILQGILDAVTLPGDVYRGEVDPRSDEAIGRAFDLAGTMTLGAGAIPRHGLELRSGMSLEQFSDKWKAKGVRTYVADRPARNQYQLSDLVVPKEMRGQGVGTEFMNELVQKADQEGRTITLTAAKDYGTTSLSRLKDFYKRFGFVENKGRNKDFSISDSMYRPPSPFAETNSAAAGVGPAGQPAPRGIRAYHGSPHSFDKFSSEKIGTGEGAQAYGHGLYFAEREGVAKSYKDALSSQTALYPDGRTVTPDWDDPGYNAIHTLAKTGGDYEKAIQEAGKITTPDWRADVIKTLRQYQKDGVTLGPPGHTYEVDIAANPEDFLDWDKPLSEQSEKVLGAIETPEFIPYGIPQFHSEELQMTGGDFMQGRDAASVAESLRQAGIPGIRYLDQGSRAAGGLPNNGFIVWDAGKPRKFMNRADADAALAEAQTAGREARLEDISDGGTRNYVVFDDSLISILKKYGVVGPVLAALGLSQAMPDRAEASEQQGGGW